MADAKIRDGTARGDDTVVDTDQFENDDGATPVQFKTSLAVLRREFPELVSRYERHYEGRTNASSVYRKALARRVRLLQEVYGFPVATSRASGTRQRNGAPSSGPRVRAHGVSRPASPAA